MEYLPPNNIIAGACKDSLQTCRNARLSKLLTRKSKSGKHKVGDTFGDFEDNESVDEGNPVKENNDDESDSVKDHKEDDDVRTEGINVNID